MGDLVGLELNSTFKVESYISFDACNCK